MDEYRCSEGLCLICVTRATEAIRATGATCVISVTGVTGSDYSYRSPNPITTEYRIGRMMNGYFGKRSYRIIRKGVQYEDTE